jgi:hypothetical protein
VCPDFVGGVRFSPEDRKEDFKDAPGGPTGIKRIYFSLRRLRRRNEKYIFFISTGEKAKL